MALTSSPLPTDGTPTKGTVQQYNVLQADIAAHKHDGVESTAHYAIGAFVWCITGNLVAGTNKGFILRTFHANIIFLECEMVVKTAPVGASIIVDINKAGTSLWATNQANRPTIADGATSGSTTSFDTANSSGNNNISIDVDQIGSSTAGANLTVTLWYKYLLLTS